MESSFVEGRVLNAIGEFALEKPRSCGCLGRAMIEDLICMSTCTTYVLYMVYWMFIGTYIHIHTYHIYIYIHIRFAYVNLCIYIYVMLQSWSSTALEQNLGHLRNHWGIEDKTFPWHCFLHKSDWSDLCIPRLVQYPNDEKCLPISPHPFFPCRTCSCNVSCADTTSGPFKAAGIWEVPLWLSC